LMLLRRRSSTDDATSVGHWAIREPTAESLQPRMAEGVAAVPAAAAVVAGVLARAGAVLKPPSNAGTARGTVTTGRSA